jgi:hypothetical protein
MTPTRPWVPRLLSAFVGLVFLLLIAEYLLGLWTNVYAPAMFTSSASTPALAAHMSAGIALFVAPIVMTVLAALRKELRRVIPSVVTVLAIGAAGVFGRMYISTTPNDPAYSFAMGTLFLVAFVSAAAVSWLSWDRAGSTATRGASDGRMGGANSPSR